MDKIDIILLVTTLLISECAVFWCWPSKTNTLGLISLSTFLVTYPLPLFVLNVMDEYPDAIQSYYYSISLVGALGTLLGVLSSKSLQGKNLHSYAKQPSSHVNMPLINLRRHRLQLAANLENIRESSRFAMRLALIGGCLLWLSMVLMHNIPIIADDPFAAKQFKGIYEPTSSLYSVMFRLGAASCTVTIPLVFAHVLENRRALQSRELIVLFIAISAMVATLQRGPMAIGILIVLAEITTRRHSGLITVIVGVLINIAGVLFYDVLALIGIGSKSAYGIQSSSLIDRIAATVPDITDQLSLLERWFRSGADFTDGKTFFGGLIPGHFPWNPSVWTITLGNSSVNIQEAVTGGLRLTTPMWGYTAAGFAGAFIVPFAAAFLIQRILRSALSNAHFRRDEPLYIRVVRTMVVYGLVGTIGSFYAIGYVDVIRLVVILIAAGPTLRYSELPHQGDSEIGTANNDQVFVENKLEQQPGNVN